MSAKQVLKNKSEEVFIMTNEMRNLKLLIRLNQYTTEYLSLEREKEKYYREHSNDMSRTTIVTLYQMQAYIDSVIKKICIMVDRLNRNQIDFDNEVATLVYNYYSPSIKRGISDLI